VAAQGRAADQVTGRGLAPPLPPDKRAAQGRDVETGKGRRHAAASPPFALET